VLEMDEEVDEDNVSKPNATRLYTF
jgi:hypothetical protein